MELKFAWWPVRVFTKGPCTQELKIRRFMFSNLLLLIKVYMLM